MGNRVITGVIILKISPMMMMAMTTTTIEAGAPIRGAGRCA